MTSVTKNLQSPTKKNFFLVQTRRLANLFKGLNSSTTISGGTMMLVRQLTTAGFRLISKYKLSYPGSSKC